MPANRVPASETVPETLIQALTRGECARQGQTHHWLEPGGLQDSEVTGYAAHRPPWQDLAVVPRLAPSSARRLELLDRGFPWVTIGEVTVGDTKNYDKPIYTATGVLVGENILLTASHVAPWGQFPGTWWMRFVPGSRGGVGPYGDSYVECFVGSAHDGSRVTGADIVACKLYRSLGRLTGWMGVHCFADDFDYSHQPLSSVGYPAPADRPIVDAFASVEDVIAVGDGLELHTAPFTEIGWSGAPLFGWIEGSHRIVGIDSGLADQIGLWSALRSQCVFAGGRRLVSLVELGRRAF